MTETQFALLDDRVKRIEQDLGDYRELRETVALLKQSVELLHKTVWGVLACVGGALVVIIFNTIFQGGM